MNKQEENVVSDMFRELKKSPDLYQPSSFWDVLNEVHLEYLAKDGFDNFKRTVNTKYFNWGTLGIILHQLSPIFRQLLRGNFAPLIDCKFEDAKNLNYFEAFIYRIYLASLFEYISQHDNLKIFDSIKEPFIGNPFVVKYKGKLISQDLCNSVYEFYSITQSTRLPKKVRIAELGAGYGRLGYVLLKTIPNFTYCVIDIPPALFIAQNYLSKVFTKEKIFKFRPFTSFKNVKKEFENSRIQILMSHQIELLPKDYFDLFINISSLHEMTYEQIRNYINRLTEFAKGIFILSSGVNPAPKIICLLKKKSIPSPKVGKLLKNMTVTPFRSGFLTLCIKLSEPFFQN